MKYNDDLTLSFRSVSKDDRCPINAKCITAGDATVVLEVNPGTPLAQTVRIHTDKKPREVVIRAYRPGVIYLYQRYYHIRIKSLNPQPEAGIKTLQSKYRLKLRIALEVSDIS